MDFNQAVQQILNTDELFQTENVEIRGTTYKAFNKVPADLKELLDYGKTVREWEEFIVYEKEKISYLDFCNQVSKLSSFLQKEVGIKKGDKVAIAMRNYPEYLTILMAVASIGGIVVFVNAWWTTEEMEYGFDDSTAKVCFADKERLATIKPFAKKKSIKLYSVRCIDDPEIKKYDDIVNNFERVDLIDVDLKPDDDFAIMNTSGSTGHPKGVVLTHRGAITATFSWLMAERVGGLLADPEKLARRRASSVLLLSPMFHVNGSHPNFFYSIARGSKIVLMYKWDPDVALDLIEREKISIFTGVPTMSYEMVEAQKKNPRDISSLKDLTGGGAARPPEQVKEMKANMKDTNPGIGYGLTETNALAANNTGDVYLQKPESTGFAVPKLIDLKIVDDDGNALPQGEIGEVCIRGACTFRCYWKNQEATDEVLDAEGWFRSGDIGLLDEDDFLYIKDRKKDIVIRGGENIACLEVEAAITEHPAVLEASVFGVPDERLGEKLATMVSYREGQNIDETELSSFLAEKLAKFKIPEFMWFQTKQLPRIASGKIAKKQMREEAIEKLGG